MTRLSTCRAPKRGSCSLEPLALQARRRRHQVAGLFAPVAAKKGLPLHARLDHRSGTHPGRRSRLDKSSAQQPRRQRPQVHRERLRRAFGARDAADVLDASMHSRPATRDRASAPRKPRSCSSPSLRSAGRGAGRHGPRARHFQQLANAMGGDLRLESLGRIRKHLHLSGAGCAERISQLTPLPRPSLVNQHSGTVLVVDDNTINAR